MTNQPSTSRAFFGYGVDALAGVISAFVLGFAVSHAGSMLVLLAYVATIPLFMAGLAGGMVSGLIAALCGIAGLFATAPPEIAIFYVLAYALPALILMFVATRRHSQNGQIQWTSEGALLTTLTLYPCLMFLIVYAATMGEGGLLAVTQNAFEGVSGQIATMMGQNGQTVTPEMAVKLHENLEAMARIAPVLGMGVWLFSTMIALIAAQSLLCQKKWNLRPAFTLTDLRVPVWVGGLVIIAATAAFCAPAPYDYVGLNIALTLAIPLFLAGLAVVHALTARSSKGAYILILFYVVICVVKYLVPVVALIGMADQWVDVRKRLADRAHSKITNLQN